MSVRRALVFSFIDRNASLLVGIASSMAVARLLTPADIGVFSVVMVLMSFATSWRDFGAGQYLVQEPELTPDRIAAVWTLQLGIGCLLALITVAGSVPAARFYDEPRMTVIMWVLAASYLVNPFGSLTYAWLMRHMRFEALAVMRFSAAVTGAIVSVTCAWRGMGAISLAWGNLASVLANALVSFAFRPAELPLLPRTKEVPRVLRFGSRMTATSLIETAAQGAPELVLGKLQGMTAVGLFSRANGLTNMFSHLVSDAVNSVAMPMFAKQRREGGSVAAAFLRSNAYVTVVGWTFAGVIGLLAGPLIRVLYGAQWDESVAIVRWLAVAMVVTRPAALCYQVLVGCGASALLPRTMLAASAATVLGAAIGATQGLMPMAWGLVAGSAISTAIWLYQAHQVTQFAWAPFRHGLLLSGAVAAIGCVPPAVVIAVAGAMPAQPLLALIVGGAGTALCFVGAALALRHPIGDELRPLLQRLRPAR